MVIVNVFTCSLDYFSDVFVLFDMILPEYTICVDEEPDV